MLQHQVSQVKLRELDGKNNILIMIIFILIIYIITTLNGISRHNNDFISNNVKSDNMMLNPVNSSKPQIV